MKETQNEVSNNSLGDMLSKSEQFFEKNRKLLISCVAVVVVVVLAIFAYHRFYAQPRQMEAAEEMFIAQNRFDNSQFELALNGDENTLGFLDIIDQYSHTPSGNLARYYAGVCQLNMGQYEAALDNLKHYKGRDIFTAAEAEMLCGDVEAELENYVSALKYYDKAASHNTNIITTPAALYKAALVLIRLERYDEAVSRLETIRHDYPRHPMAVDVDKLMGAAQTL